MALPDIEEHILRIAGQATPDHVERIDALLQYLKTLPEDNEYEIHSLLEPTNPDNMGVINTIRRQMEKDIAYIVTINVGYRLHTTGKLGDPFVEDILRDQGFDVDAFEEETRKRSQDIDWDA